MKIEKLSIIVLIFFVSMSLFSMSGRRDYIDGMSEDPLYNELIRSIFSKGSNRVEACLIIRIRELLKEAKEKGIDDRDAYVAEGLQKFVCTSIKGPDEHGLFPLYLAALEEKHPEIVELLLAVGADPNQRCCDGKTSLEGRFSFIGAHQTSEYEKALLVPFLKHGVSLPSSYIENILLCGYYDILLLIFQSKIKMPGKVALISGELVTPLEFSNDLMSGVECRRYCISDHCVNIVLRYPQVDPEEMRGLPYGPNDEYLVEDEEIMLFLRDRKRIGA